VPQLESTRQDAVSSDVPTPVPDITSVSDIPRPYQPIRPVSVWAVGNSLARYPHMEIYEERRDASWTIKEFCAACSR
jgi:hypothetical protein